MPDSPDHQQQLIDAVRRQVEAARANSDARRQLDEARDRAASRTVRLPAEGRDDALPAAVVAGYDVVREVHRGGQGVVYEALQKSTGRRVAIKVMREGPFTGRADLLRFEREVQILAQFNHPNIVGIVDSGVSAGHAYFVMDFIDGRALDRWMADFRAQLGPQPGDAPGTSRSVHAAHVARAALRDVLPVFAKICETVHSAHLRGVIHRDLKPGNIRIDNAGEPHVLDFGLAKLATEDVAEDPNQPTMTRTGQFLGSMPWASPEQARGAAAQVDVRTDVYSLGVILYQLVTGRFPYDVAGNLPDVLHRILNAEPTAPSAIQRQNRSGPITAISDEELDTIVLKCLQKDPARRYQSAGELARDLRHYLAGEPIEAKRDSFAYLARKSFVRYRTTLAVASLFMLVLAAGLVASLVLWRSASHQADRAGAEARKARQFADFLKTVFQSIDPEYARGRDITILKQVLDDAAAKIDGGEIKEPEVEADLRGVLGDVYQKLGLYSLAERHLRVALDWRRKSRGDADIVTLAAAGNLAGALLDLSRGKEALELCTAFEPAARARSRGDGARQFLLNTLALALIDVSRPADAEKLMREQIAELDGENARKYERTFTNNLAICLVNQGKYAEAEPILRRVLAAMQDVHGPDNAATLAMQRNLAVTLGEIGRTDESISIARDALDHARASLGERHPETIMVMIVLAAQFRLAGRLDEAEGMIRDALDRGREVLGPKNIELYRAVNHLGMILQTQQRWSEAEPILREAVALATGLRGPDDTATASAEINLGLLLSTTGHHAEAESLLRHGHAVRRKLLPPESPDTAQSANNLARALLNGGKFDEAATLFRESYDLIRRSLPPDHPVISIPLGGMAVSLLKSGQYAAAESALREYIDRQTKLGDPDLGQQKLMLASCMIHQNRHAEAEAALLDVERSLLPDSDEARADVHQALVELYESWEKFAPGTGKSELAARWRDKSVTSQPASTAPSAP